MDVVQLLSRIDDIKEELFELAELSKRLHGGIMLVDNQTIFGSIKQQGLDLEKLKYKINDQDTIRRFVITDKNP